MLGPIRVHGLTRAEAGERAVHYLTRVGVGHRKDACPGFLSGGEQQRVAIARALDPELVGEVLHVMRGLAEEGRTMIVATHVMNFVRDVASRVVFLDQGGPGQVLRHPRTVRLQGFLAAQAA